MAKKEETPKTVLERVYSIPLRKETLKVPPFKKANKAVRAVREFISKHMKSDNVVIGKYLNLMVWRHGAKNPPHHVKVNVSKDSKGRVFVEIAGAPKEEQKAEESKKPAKEEEKIVKEAKFKETPEEKIEKKAEGAKEEKTEESKKIEKEEIRELQKEHPKHHAQKMMKQPKEQIMRPTAPKSV